MSNDYGLGTNQWVQITDPWNTHQLLPKIEMSVDELREFKEDNNLDDYYEYLIQGNYVYYKYLVRLYNVTQQVPLYYYNERRELTRYYSPEPPKVFSGLLASSSLKLGVCWDNLYVDLKQCFHIPFGEDVSPYKTRKGLYSENGYVKALIQEYKPGSSLDYRFCIDPLHVGFGEVWCKSGDFIYPVTLLLSLTESKSQRDVSHFRDSYEASRCWQFILNISQQYFHVLKAY